MDSDTTKARLDEARAAIERVMAEYDDVLSPVHDPDERPVLTHWVMVCEYADMASSGSWCGIRTSKTTWAHRVGMLQVALHDELSGDDA